MARFWIIAPYAANPAENFESGWDFDLANNTISIGWPGLGNVLNMTEAELNEEVPRQAAADQATHSEHAVVLYRVIRPGDTVLARSGRKVEGHGPISPATVRGVVFAFFVCRSRNRPAGPDVTPWAVGSSPPQLSTFSAAIKASCGMSTLPNCRIFFLPSFCFSRSLRLRVMSPP
jgi:hypothetical protein